MDKPSLDSFVGAPAAGGGKTLDSFVAPTTPEAPGFFSRIGSDLSARFNSAVASDKAAADKGIGTGTGTLESTLRQAQGGFNIVGQGAGAVADVAGEVLKPLSDVGKGALDLMTKGISKLNEFAQSIPGVTLSENALDTAGKHLLLKAVDNPNIISGIHAINNGIDAYKTWSEKNPEDSKTIDGAVNIGLLLSGAKADVATGASETVAKVGADAVDLGGKAVDKTLETAGKGADAVKKVVAGVPETAPELVGKITQGKILDIPSATNALKSVDTTGVKTFKDLSNVLAKKATENTTAVDTAFGKSTDVFKPKDLTKAFTVGDTTVKHNFVNDAISHLQELYSKTNEPANLAKINDLAKQFKTDGLSPKSINDLAKTYGTEFGNKAFSKTSGDALTSVNAQSYENVRTGVKETARELMPDENTRTIDKNTSELLRTKKLVDTMDKKVQVLQNKLQKATPLQKVGGMIGKGVDVITGGLAKSLLKNLLDIGVKEGSPLNPIELQNALKSNIKKLNDLIFSAKGKP